MRALHFAMLGLLLSSCGKSSGKDSHRGTTPPEGDAKPKKPGCLHIIGGKDAPVDHHSSVGFLVLPNGEVHGECTGTLLCGNVVLTAAHCVVEALADPMKYRFGLGSGNASVGPAWSDLDSVAVTAIEVNPNEGISRKIEGAAHDMALFKLARNVESTVYPLARKALTPEQAAAVGKVEIIGFGNTQPTSKEQISGVRRQGSMTFLGHDSEVQAWVLTERRAGDDDTCPGDSGSPLFVKDEIYGVLNGGDKPGCGDGTQSWWASVPDDRAWLEDVAGGWCQGPSSLTVTKPTKVTGDGYLYLDESGDLAKLGSMRARRTESTPTDDGSKPAGEAPANEGDADDDCRAD